MFGSKFAIRAALLEALHHLGLTQMVKSKRSRRRAMSVHQPLSFLGETKHNLTTSTLSSIPTATGGI
jgi:hypothetical protein